MKQLFAIVIGLCFCFAAVASSEAESYFNSGNQLYQEAKFEEALAEYLKISDSESFELYFNIGNTYYKLNNIPRAILYYEKAARISPSNEDLKMNLSICNSKIVDKIDELPSLGVDDLWTKITSSSMAFTWNSLFLIFFGLCFVFGLIYFWKKKFRLPIFLGIAISGFLALMFFILSFQTHNRTLMSQSAIIMTPKVDVKGSPNEEGIDVFVLHEGTKVKVIQELEQWSEIRIANGNAGWIKSESLENI